MTANSKKTLVDKLGIKANSRLLLVNTPFHYLNLLQELPPNTVLHTSVRGKYDFIHFFTKDKNTLERLFPYLKRSLHANGTFWVSWPKQTSRMSTDLKEPVVQAIGLDNGLVDTKVAAIDDNWSGLKFVYRNEDREPA